MRYFIFDCFGKIVGNPKGYRTFRGAARMEKILYPIIWDQYDKMKEIEPMNTLLSRIGQYPCAPEVTV